MQIGYCNDQCIRGHDRTGLESKPARTLLEQGYSLRGTVLSAEKGVPEELFKEYGNKLELADVTCPRYHKSA